MALIFKGGQLDSVPRVKVLLVDDFEPFRNWVSSLFRQEPDFEIIGEAADGQQGVQQATELKPDLVVVDLALPRLNGIEVTRQIRCSSPDSKIVLLTGNDFPQLARAALDSGASGYVIKSDAAGELFAAVRAVLQGRQYVSKRLIGCDLIEDS
jgi:DNA-binding NarL/FixJ family response regulator